MTGKFFIDVVGGSGFLSKATHHLGLRGYVLDTKFGSRCDVAQPFVLTRIRQEVSAGKMRRRKDLTSTTTHLVLSQNYFRHYFHRLLASSRMPWILEHPCDSWLCGRAENPDPCGAASHGLGPGRFLCFWISVQQANVVSGRECGQQGCTPCCTKVCWDRRALQCFTSKHGHPKNVRITF